MPAVSVIVPTYNRCKLLHQAIQSVLDQTFADFELIVINDGSTDETESMVQSMPDKRIVYLYQDNRGRSMARNLGLRQAKGEYLCFLDDDDLYLPHKLEVQLGGLLKCTDVDLVASGARITDLQGNILKTARPWINRRDPVLFDCLAECRLLMCSVLCRRKAVLRMRQWFDPELSLAEDHDFWTRLAHSGSRMAWLPSVVCSYRLYQRGTPFLSVGYSIACIQVLDGFFKRQDIPRAIIDQKDIVYARRYLFAALRSYAGQLAAMGQRFLDAAARLDRALLVGRPPRLVQIIAEYACEELLEEREKFIDYIFSRMPASLSHLAVFQKTALEEVHLHKHLQQTQESDFSVQESEA